MQNNTSLQIAASAVFLILAVIFLNPFHTWMIGMFHMLVLGLLVVTFGVLVVFVVSESVRDEREAAHRMLAGRAAFLVGAAVLLIGIVWQSFTGVVDVWLILTLSCMVMAKIAARLYGEQVR